MMPAAGHGGFPQQQGQFSGQTMVSGSAPYMVQGNGGGGPQSGIYPGDSRYLFEYLALIRANIVW